MKIINIGPFPPPYGGVSNHLNRLIEFLESKNVDHLFIDISDFPKTRKNLLNLRARHLISFLLRKQRSIVHFHVFSFIIMLIVYLASFRHIVFYSFHNERFYNDINQAGLFKSTLIKYFLKRADLVLVSNQNCIELAEQLGLHKERIKCIPEFIPPNFVPELDNELILNLRKQHQFVISSNAFQISFHKGEDLYGIDLLIELINNLVNVKKMSVACFFLLPNIKDAEYFNILNERIRKYSIQDHFLFITEPLRESASLWTLSDVIVRATNTDGNALTIWEALYLGIPIIASDCVIRPEGTLLFKNRDFNDLTNKIIDVIINIEHHKEMVKLNKVVNHAEIFLETYKQYDGNFYAIKQ